MKVIILILMLFHTFILNGQNVIIQWQKCFGGTAEDRAKYIKETSDGGFIVAGYTFSINGDITFNNGSQDIWILKLDQLGNIQWQKCFGGYSWDEAKCIDQTSDGGYIIAGSTRSNDGDVTNNYSIFPYFDDAWILKIDSLGNLQWQRNLGGTKNDIAYSIIETFDGNYLMVGASSSNDMDLTNNYGNTDCWIVKLTSNGTIDWQKNFGGFDSEYATRVKQTNDHGYVISGVSGYPGWDVSFNNGSSDFWLVKMDSIGNIQWDKSFGGSNSDNARDIEIDNFGYILAGVSSSSNGDVTGNHGYTDYWIVKTGWNGNLQWQKSLGGTKYEGANSIIHLNNNYIVVGSTTSSDGDVTCTNNYSNIWVTMLDSTGNINWTKCLGGSNEEDAYFIQPTTDGGFIIAASTKSNDGDVSGNHGYWDFWIVKIADVTLVENPSDNLNLTIVPNPTTDKLNIKFSLDYPSDVVVNLTNNTGQLIFHHSFGKLGVGEINFEISTKNYAKGLYLLNLIIGGKKASTKIQKY